MCFDSLVLANKSKYMCILFSNFYWFFISLDWFVIWPAINSFISKKKQTLKDIHLSEKNKLIHY